MTKTITLGILSVPACVIALFSAYISTGLTHTALRTEDQPSDYSLRAIEQGALPTNLHVSLDDASPIRRKWATKLDANASTIDVYLPIGSEQAVLNQGQSARVVAVLRNVEDETAIVPYLDRIPWSGRLDQWTALPAGVSDELKAAYPDMDIANCILLRMNDAHSVWLLPAMMWFGTLAMFLLALGLGAGCCILICKHRTALQKLAVDYAAAGERFPRAAALALARSDYEASDFSALAEFSIPTSQAGQNGVLSCRRISTVLTAVNIAISGIAFAALMTGFVRPEIAFALIGVAMLGQYIASQYLQRQYVPLVQMRIHSWLCGYSWTISHQLAMRQLRDWNFKLLGDYSQFYGASPVVRSLAVGSQHNVLVEVGRVRDCDFTAAISLFENGLVLETTSLTQADIAAQNEVPLYIRAVPNGNLLEILDAHAASIAQISRSLDIGLARIDQRNWQQLLQYAVDLARIDLAKQGRAQNAPSDLCAVIGSRDPVSPSVDR